MLAPVTSRFPAGTELLEFDLPNGIHLRGYARGSGPRTALFLHGFPELALSWKEQLAACPEGFRCVALDLRGYGGSSAPREVSAYAMPKLIEDVKLAIAALGADKVDLAGHDWGGALAWEFARAHPGLLRTLAICNCPPADLLLANLRRWKQLRMSWYILAFQVPGLAEWALRRDPETMALKVFKGMAKNRAPFTRESLAPYVDQFRAGLAGVHYYRAAARRLKLRKHAPIAVPTRLIWGMQDKALGPWFAEESAYREIASDFDIVRIEESGHWVQQEAPAQVNAALHAHWQRA